MVPLTGGGSANSGSMFCWKPILAFFHLFARNFAQRAAIQRQRSCFRVEDYWLTVKLIVGKSSKSLLLPDIPCFEQMTCFLKFTSSIFFLAQLNMHHEPYFSLKLLQKEYSAQHVGFSWVLAVFTSTRPMPMFTCCTDFCYIKFGKVWKNLVVPVPHVVRN